MRALLAASLLVLAACPRNPGTFVWVDDFEQPVGASSRDYVIVTGDTLNVRVFQQENITSRVKVRNDGKVSLPFVDDVQAAGMSPQALATALELKLKEFINNPVVTVSLEEAKPVPISCLGEVIRPGVYPVEPGAGILQILALAGGFTEFAHKDSIFVLRGATRVRFTYEKLSRAEGKAASFVLQANDVVVVE